jgi:CDP-diacylglycerol--glycerol-3-phosphate 3-phosphatidyltransferase
MLLPNQLTIARIVLTPVFMYLFLSDNPLMKQISLGVFIVAAITDWYDGWLARKFNYITAWGKFLDPLADKILTSSAFIAFIYLDVLELWMVLIIVVRDFLITGLRAYAEYRKQYFSTSILAKWKTFFQMVFIYYLLLIYVLGTVGYIEENYQNLWSILKNETMIYWLMFGITFFTLITGIKYIFNNRLLIKKLASLKN